MTRWIVNGGQPLYYPVMLNISGKLCVVVGGGPVAARKIKGLLRCGALVRVVSPQVSEEIQSMLKTEPGVEWLNREYELGDLTNSFLVFAATDDRLVNEMICREAKEAGIPVNVADDPESCDFIVPATVRQGDLVIGVSTGGKSPGLSKAIADDLKGQFDGCYRELVLIMERLRNWVLAQPRRQVDKHRLLYTLNESYKEILSQLRNGKAPDQLFEEVLNRLSLEKI